MITIQIDQGDAATVDRSGSSSTDRDGRQGFEIYFLGASIIFEDEDDALKIARKILYRLGETFGKDETP